MDHDSERDEAITDARISGVSARALAKLHGCSSREVEEAVDRRLDYTLDNRQRMRLVKLSVERISALMKPFYERAIRDKDCAAGTLCVKLEERLSLLLGLDQPVQSRIDVYQATVEEQPKPFDQLYEMICRIGRQKDGNGADDAELEQRPGDGNSQGDGHGPGMG
jgi:hypothetical protein